VRVLNSFLHLAVNLLFVLLFLCAMGKAQTQGNLPNVKDGAIDGIIGGTPTVITWPEQVNVDDTLVMCGDTSRAGGPFPLADTLGNTWTCTTPTQSPAPATNGYINMCYTKSAFAGADTISWTVPSNDGAMVGGRFAGLGVVDGSLATATFIGVGAGGAGTISTSNTTAVNNDLIIACNGRSSANSGSFISTGNGEIVSAEGDGTPMLSLKRTGTKGSQTTTVNTWNGPAAFGSNTTFTMQSFAFKPTTNIALADTVLPDAATGVAYSAQLHCQGGTAAQTYSVVSGTLPTGITLTGATGLLTATNVTGTTQTVGFQCTDGTITSATDSLTLTVGAGFNTPSIRSYVNTFDGFSASVTGAACGDLIVMLARGTDTHNDSGWVQVPSGANNKITDSFNSPVQRMVLPIGGNSQTPLLAYIVGPITQAGTDVISIANNQNANPGLNVSGIWDVSGVQAVVDQGASGTAMIDNGSFNANYTTLVPNTLILADASSRSGGITLSFGAPFSSDSVGGDVFVYSIFGHALISSAGATTLTTTITGASAVTPWGSLMVPLRPALPIASCSVFTGSGEKIRRQVF
jgi:hypothetical protein